MSKRSGMSRLEDLKRGFVDVGRYRYILHKFDMETWRDKTCPVCGEGFTSEPNYYMNSYAIHSGNNPNSKGEECAFSDKFEQWVQDTFYREDD